MMTKEHDIPVLVVGGSLVGLTTSLLLSSRGVPNLLVERHRGTAIHPRAASFHQRTMEIFRGVGLQQQIEEAAAREFVQNGAIIAVESLSGAELKYFYTSFNDGVEGLSPTSRLFITQIGLEPVIRDRAAELGAVHRFGTELVSFEQDENEVRAVIRARDGGEPEPVRAQYLVAADGAHSSIRQQLGIAMQGRGSFAHCITIYFKADVRPMLGDRNLSVVYVNHPTLLGFFRFSISGDSGFLAVFVTSDADGGNRTTDIAANASADQCRAYVRTALGCGPELPIEIDSVQPWQAQAGWAERFAAGRVFLAGDAAHVMPPTGGFGGNTGIADAHNLAWKLAAVLDGSAGPGLLASYDAERRPSAALTVEQAYTRYVLRVDSTLPQEDLAPPRGATSPRASPPGSGSRCASTVPARAGTCSSPIRRTSPAVAASARTARRSSGPTACSPGRVTVPSMIRSACSTRRFARCWVDRSQRRGKWRLPAARQPADRAVVIGERTPAGPASRLPTIQPVPIAASSPLPEL